MRIGTLGVVLSLTVVGACSPPPQTVLRFASAPELVVPPEVELWITFWNAGSRQHEAGERIGPFEYREDIKVTVDARDGDAARRFTVFAELLTPEGIRLSWTRIRTGFGSDRLSEVRVTFANGCPPPSDQALQNDDYEPRGACGSHDTCVPEDGGGRCSPACAVPEPFVATRGQAPTPLIECRDRDCAAVNSVHTVGEATCALVHEGEAFCWSRTSFPRSENYFRYPSRTLNPSGRSTLPDDGRVVSIAGFINHLCQLYDDGRLACGGANITDTMPPTFDLGLSEHVPRDSPIPCCMVEPELPEGGLSEIVSGSAYTCGLTRADGRVVCIGRHPHSRAGETEPMPGLVEVRGPGHEQLLAGRFSLCRRLNDEFPCVGSPLDFGTELTVAVEDRLVANERSLCAVSPAGELRCWGAGLDADFVSETPYETQPTSLGGGWQQVALSRSLSSETNHRCGIRIDGTLQCWGSNEFGQAGASDTGSGQGFGEEAPHTLDGTWSDVALGRRHTCGIQADRQLYCWGRNSNEQLGMDGPDRTEPTRVCIPSW